MSINHGNKLRLSLLGSTAVVMACLSLGSGQAYAQDMEESVEEVVVTGSRIARKDLASPSPVSVVSGDEFRLQGTPNVEQVLNALPQTIPGFGSSSNNPGNGTATVNLRGLGSSRTLVLVDGRRYLQSSQGGVVDLNTIPAALIKQVEVVTGGASAVYGSDALAGVVNFVLRDDFEGVELSGQYDQTTHSDAKRYNMDMTIGGNFADGKGNATVNIGYINRSSLFQGDRKAATYALGDCATTAPFDSDYGTGEVANGKGFCQSGSSGIPSTRVWGLADVDGNTIHTFDSAGNGLPAWERYNYAPVNYLQLPQERYLVTGTSHYEVSDALRFSMRGTFVSNRVDQELAPTPAFLGSVEVNPDSPFFGSNVQATLDAQREDTNGDGVIDGDDNAYLGFLGRRMLENGSRQALNTRNAFQIMLGADGEFDNGWNYTAYYSTSQVDYTELLNNDVSETRFRQAILVSDDGTSCQVAGGGCAPLNIFGAGNISDDAIGFINVGAANVTAIKQEVAQATISGTTGGIGGGDIGMSFGAEWRSDKSNSRPDSFLSAGDVLGFNAGQPTVGDYSVKALFGEAVVPLIEGVELTGAARYSDYSNVGGVWSYAGGLSWAPIEDIKFRAQYQRAVRAPNVAELFAGLANGFPGASDPCAVQLNGDLPSASLEALCIATGVAADDFGVYEQSNSQIEGRFGGNPNLAEEVSDTYTVGVIIEPEAIPGLDITIDYYDITINSAIGTLGGGVNNILDICYNIVADAGDQHCQAITRRADSNVDYVTASNANIAQLTTAGVDFQVNYSADLNFGFMSDTATMVLFFQGTYLDEYTSTPVVALENTIACADTFTCGEPMPAWRHNVRASLHEDSLSVSAFWRYIGKSEDKDPSAGATVTRLDPANYFDLSVSYDITENVLLTVGSTNLFDKQPQFLGDAQEQANTFPSTYDAIGRRIFINATAKF